jgi:DNA-binding response OmpR family regulator
MIATIEGQIMVKPPITNSHGSDHRRISTQQIGDDKIIQSSIVDLHGHHKRILVVDDNSDIAFTLRIGLENGDAAMQVYSYDNPVKALADFEPDFYDLLLVDINMPLMNGFELCQKMLQKDLNIKVCFMTSGEINMDAVREVHPLKSIGCFIEKPIATDKLVKRIKAELE